MSVDVKASVEAPFSKRKGQGVADLRPHVTAIDNGFTERALSKTGLSDNSVVDVWSVDSNNNVLLAGATAPHARNEASFFLQTNSLQGKQPFYISDGYYYVTSVTYRHTTACTTSGA